MCCDSCVVLWILLKQSIITHKSVAFWKFLSGVCVTQYWILHQCTWKLQCIVAGNLFFNSFYLKNVSAENMKLSAAKLETNLVVAKILNFHSNREPERAERKKVRLYVLCCVSMWISLFLLRRFYENCCHCVMSSCPFYKFPPGVLVRMQLTILVLFF